MTAKITADASGTKVTIGTAAEDALQIDATAKTIKALSPYKLSADNALGVGQTWQLPTRALGGDYTNSTGRSIMVSLNISAVAGTIAIASVYCQNVLITQISAKMNEISGSFSFVVPPGATYSVQGALGSPAPNVWSELR